MTPVSDETLNALVDGELDVADSEVLIARLREDPELSQRVCALRSLKSMVQLAYVEPPRVPGREAGTASHRRLAQRCALGCLVVLAGLGGWLVRGLESPPGVTARVEAGLPDGYRAVSLVQKADPDRVMLHLDSAAPDKMRAALDQAEKLLGEAEQEGRAMRLEIIANSLGIQLMRAGHSPYSERIALMKQRHANLYWVACGQSISRFANEGQTVALLPATRTAPSAIGEIVTRLQQGWTYVRV